MRHAVETVAEAWAEIVPLARAHHAEHGIRWPFDPQRKFYDALEQVQSLALYTMRDEAGSLWGYATFVVSRHPHFDCLMAAQDTVYVAPEKRGLLGGKFLVWTDRQLQARGVQQVLRLRAAGWPDGGLKRLGYVPGDGLMVKQFGGGHGTR